MHGSPQNRGSVSMWRSSRRCRWLRVVKADVEQQAAASSHTCSSILGAQQHEQAPVIAHGAHTANGQSCKQQRTCGACFLAPGWVRARAGRVEPKCAAQLALTPSPSHCSPSSGRACAFAPKAQKFCKLPEAVGRSKIRFELCTSPELVRAECGSAARAVGGRRHEAGKTVHSTEPRYM